MASNLQIDLQHGVVPVSRAASALATLIKRSAASAKPIVITQKGYPTGVLLSIELYTALRNLARNGGELVIESANAETEIEAAEPEDESLAPKRRTRKAEAEPPAEAVAEAAPPTAKGRRGRKKAVQDE